MVNPPLTWMNGTAPRAAPEIGMNAQGVVWCAIGEARHRPVTYRLATKAQVGRNSELKK